MAGSNLTKTRLRSILSRRLRLEDPRFIIETAGGRLVGDVISPSFAGKRDRERQEMIWDALRAELGDDARKQVGMFLAFTPDEWNLDQNDKPAEKKRKAG
jgi:acid stress-induced BolA-like protein IbaG/YrbA